MNERGDLSHAHILNAPWFPYASLWDTTTSPAKTRDRSQKNGHVDGDVISPGASCASGIHRCSAARVKTRLFLARAAHTCVSLQQGDCLYVHVTWGSASEELTNIQSRPGGEAESMESKRKGAKRRKIILNLKYKPRPQQFAQNLTHKQIQVGEKRALAPAHPREDYYIIWFEIFQQCFQTPEWVEKAGWEFFWG